MKKNNTSLTFFIVFVVSVVLIAIIASFFLIGSPGQQRMKRFDEQRSSNLQTLERAIIQEWEENSALPETIDVIKDELYNREVVTDPETSEPYIYRQEEANQFTLCAVFALEAENDRLYLDTKTDYIERLNGSYYTHTAGENCYTVILDQDRYQELQEGNTLPQDFVPRAY